MIKLVRKLRYIDEFYLLCKMIRYQCLGLCTFHADVASFPTTIDIAFRFRLSTSQALSLYAFPLPALATTLDAVSLLDPSAQPLLPTFRPKFPRPNAAPSLLDHSSYQPIAVSLSWGKYDPPKQQSCQSRLQVSHGELFLSLMNCEVVLEGCW